MISAHNNYIFLKTQWKTQTKEPLILANSRNLPASVSIVASPMAGARFCKDNKMNFVLANYTFM
jgi:hypothetical protein